MDKQSFNQILSNHQNQVKQPVQHQQTYKQPLPIGKIHKIRGPPKGSKRKPNLAAGIKAGIWTLNQMKGYLKFITRFENHFKDKATRKKKKIFHRMSNFIKSRTAEQCRSHHQKLELKFNLHQEIINYIKNQIQLKLQQARQKLLVLQNQKNDNDQLKMVVKTQNIQASMIDKQIEKKTHLKDSDQYYEIKQTRQGLFITISAQNMQIW